MVAAGGYHSILLRSNGQAVSCGFNMEGQCDIPPLPPNVEYVQVSSADYHSAFIRSDGQAVACGLADGRTQIPELPDGLTYVQVCASTYNTYLLRSDGAAVVCGSNWNGCCDVPKLPDGVSFVHVCGGETHAVFLRSDDVVETLGSNKFGQRDIPPLEAGYRYVQVSAGRYHTALLRNDGTAVVVGGNSVFGDCARIPPLTGDLMYVEVSAGMYHTVFLRSDGIAVASGRNNHGQCMISMPQRYNKYIYASAGGDHTLVLCRDGTVHTYGNNEQSQCAVPDTRTWSELFNLQPPTLKYVRGTPATTRLQRRDIVVQVRVTRDGNGGYNLVCYNLAGEALQTMQVSDDDYAQDVQQRLETTLCNRISGERLRTVLPDGQLLCNASPYATLRGLNIFANDEQEEIVVQDDDMIMRAVNPTVTDTETQLDAVHSSSLITRRTSSFRQKIHRVSKRSSQALKSGAFFLSHVMFGRCMMER